ncbi:hypothetical protein DEAC_c08910 [Desulfosporosinus acididurans]|uniref:Uncharacterized protein n=1 Tax=Desulfosporosinus acididurans TaxID=476652 RepID=A0A0J1FUH1_9FIRM|nr:hypothetical protein [Desulfosporosinus acididurans]KLU66957.1 hypothetical protein DEAC_c08910 [Desulfosporosinus acididurans]
MNSFDIKRVIGKLEPDDDMEQRLSAKLNGKLARGMPFKPIAVIAAGLIVAIGAGVLANYQIATPPKSAVQNNTPDNTSIAFLPDNKGGNQAEQKIQGNNAQNSNLPQPNNNLNNSQINSQINDQPTDQHTGQNNSQTETVVPQTRSDSGVQAPSLPPTKQNGNSEALQQNNGANSSQQIPAGNETTPEPRTLLRGNGNNGVSSQAPISQGLNQQNEGIYIPKVQLPVRTKDSVTTAKMMELIVYQGRIYIHSSLPLDLNRAAALVGEKLGTTKSTITEWSQQNDYDEELASTVGIQDVYSVKGYDKSFRIMTYGQINGEVDAQFFDCLNGITVKTGHDIVGKFQIENHIASVRYEDFDSWNNGKNNYKSLLNLDQFNVFLAALENSVPVAEEDLDYLFSQQGTTDQRFIDIRLKDGSGVELRLFKEGYVYINGVNIFFKVDSLTFNNFWNGLT